MRIDEERLKDVLEELYVWYFRQGQLEYMSDYNAGKCDGGIEAVGSIYLEAYGGEELKKFIVGLLAEHKRSPMYKTANEEDLHYRQMMEHWEKNLK